MFVLEVLYQMAFAPYFKSVFDGSLQPRVKGV